MSSPAADIHLQRSNRAARPWRVLFIVYALALTTGTHWPGLELDVNDMPAPDKLVHMLGFGGLAFLLWRTRWLGSGWKLAGAAVLWTLLDEITQAIPGLNRTFSWLDVLAGWMGVALVLAWVWALKPIGGPLSRMRCGVHECAVDEVFLTFRAWLSIIAAGVAGAAVIGPALGMLVYRVQPESVLSAIVAGAAVGGGALAMVVFGWQLRRTTSDVINRKRCTACGEPTGDLAFDGSGRGRCGHCAADLHAGQWLAARQLPAPLRSESAMLALTTAVGLIILVIAGYLLLLATSRYLPWLMRLVEFTIPGAMPADLRLVIDLTIIGVIAAAAVRVLRYNTALRVDRQHAVCIACRYDLRATAAPNGIGTCGECGTRFVRLGT